VCKCTLVILERNFDFFVLYVKRHVHVLRNTLAKFRAPCSLTEHLAMNAYSGNGGIAPRSH
jgi:hypothetical protein